MPGSTIRVSSLFGTPVQLGAPRDMGRYPSFYSDMFGARDALVGSTRCIALETKGRVKLVPLLKAVARIQEDAGLPCVVVAPRLSAYQRRRLSQEGVAWLSSEEIFHIPFLGMASVREPQVRKVDAPSPQAFRILAEYLSGALEGMGTQQVAAKIGKSLSRTGDYFRELDSLFPGLVGAKGRTRFLDPAMRSRVLELLSGAEAPSFSVCAPDRHYLKLGADPRALVGGGFKWGGMTALANATMVADDPWPTLAIGKKAFRNTELLEGALEVSVDDDPDLLIEVWPYELDDREGASVLPLEVWLSLREEAAGDERVAAAAEEMLRRG